MAQLVKLEPGDILVLANLGPAHDMCSDEEHDDAGWLTELKERLQLNSILIFEGDVDLSSLPAGWTPEAPAVALRSPLGARPQHEEET